MGLRAARRTLAVVATVSLTTAGIAGAVDLQAAIEAPVRVMGSRAEAGDAAVPALSADPDGLSRADIAGDAPTEDASHGESETARDDRDGEAGVWAVVVGIDDYPGSGRDLRAGVADARDMEATLDAFQVPASQRQVLLDGAATRDALMGALDWLAANAGPRATAVVFFSGHVRQVHGDPDGDGEEADEVMVLADGATVSDGELKAALDRMRAQRIWVVMAACYGGGFDDVMAPGRLLTAAAPEGVLAYENDRFGRTYLVEYMLRRALLGGVAASVQDAFAWAVEALRHDYPTRLPVIFDQTGEPLTLGPALAPPPPVTIPASVSR